MPTRPTVSKTNVREVREWLEDRRCPICGTKLVPDKKSHIFGTKKWDGHTYRTGCGHITTNARILIG